MPFSADANFLQAALGGLKYRLSELDRRIAEVKAELNTSHPAMSPAQPATAGRKRRPMSAAVRKRIAAAQRERWKKYHEAKR